MGVIHYDQAKVTMFRERAQRRIGYNDHLMMVVVDFEAGPQSEPDPPHAHPHEQVTYVAAGEVNFVLGGKSTHLKVGDMVVVPSDELHTIQLLTPHVRLIDCFTPIREDFLS